MNITINFLNFIELPYPAWSIILVVILAFLLAGVLYYRKTFENNRPLTFILYLLRAIGFLLILLLLLNPFISRSQNEEQPARLLFLQDNTRSIYTVQDSQSILAYNDALNDFLKKEENIHPVDAYVFDQEVKPMETPESNLYEGKITDVSQALSFADDMHHADHVGAMVIATDGIYNRGSNPAYFKARGNYPVFVLALGDTTPAQDVRIRQVLYNEIVRKNETSEIEVDITGDLNQNSSARVSLQLRSGNTWKTLSSESLKSQDKGEFFKTITFQRKYEDPGIDHMRVVISGISNDLHPVNNVRDFFVEILETSRKIQIVSTFPHPDIGAMRSILTENDNNEVEVTLVERPADLPDQSDFNILIFYQLPAVPYLIDFIKKSQSQDKGIILTAGLKTNYKAFNEVQDLINITPRTPTGNMINTQFNPQFDLFEVSQEFEDYITRFPPLTGIFGDYQVTGQGQTLLFQNIGDINTGYPVVFAGVQGGSRMATINVEGIWKWRLAEYFEKQETPVLNELLDKIVEYVGQKKDDRLFRLQKNKLLFDETEDITFQAELYNETLERINDPDVFFELRDSSGNKSEFTFDKTSNGYKLNLGKMAPGNYTYRAHTTTGGKNYEENGRFSVRNIDLENYSLEANHRDMSTMALQNNGKMFYDFPSLQKELAGLPGMKPVLIQSHIKTAIIDWKWLFGIILFIFTAEWFLRRYFGSY